MDSCEHGEHEAGFEGLRVCDQHIRRSCKCLRIGFAEIGRAYCCDCDLRLSASLQAKQMVAEAAASKTDGYSGRGLPGSAEGLCEGCADLGMEMAPFL